MSLPSFNEEGNLPAGVHKATLREVLERFGHGSVQRRAVSERLNRLHQLVSSTGQLARFIVFGSFVTAKDEPKDVDILLLMEDSFDLASVTGDVAVWRKCFLDIPFRSIGRGAGDDRILAGAPRRRPTRHRGDPTGGNMIANDDELRTTLERVTWFQNQVAFLRKTEKNPVNYRAAVAGFLAEIDRMQLEVREYLSFLPAERAGAA